jgi:LysR family nitrogen assimilation transcriptional regulator
MDVRQLKYFLRIVELKSFSEASKHLRIAQPALGLQVRKLEDELEVKLLERHARGVTPTSAG